MVVVAVGAVVACVPFLVSIDVPVPASASVCVSVAVQERHCERRGQRFQERAVPG